ncbi:MAG: PQQ-binding-like beta-propeller repeat protein, partial [Planctomycetales bacterium]|nr:PQQ-binding-like beta-propeller repeat protein [Planctomycetales bacterium]
MLAAIAGGLAVTALVQAANWPEFRGPTGQGHATAQNLPTEWSDTQNVVWKQPLPGEGWSSPALVDGRLYLTAAIPVENGKEGDRSLSLLILDAQSGRLL